MGMTKTNQTWKLPEISEYVLYESLKQNEKKEDIVRKSRGTKKYLHLVYDTDTPTEMLDEVEEDYLNEYKHTSIIRDKIIEDHKSALINKAIRDEFTQNKFTIQKNLRMMITGLAGINSRKLFIQKPDKKLKFEENENELVESEKQVENICDVSEINTRINHLIDNTKKLNSKNR